MSKIYLTSDTHFCHDRKFLYVPRGFKTVWDMNKAIVSNWNQIVNVDDDVYILGDIMLNNNEQGLKLLKSLKGQIHIVRGNHDTDTRIALYKDCYNVVEVADAIYLKYNHYHFYLTHYPCYTGNLEKESLKQMTLNLSGHTHSKDKFFNDLPFVYNVACDAHNCTPVNIETIIHDMYDKVEECKYYL